MKKYRDHFFLKAKQEHYPARSVYKLKEIDKNFHLFKPGMKVLDLGAAPGSWSLAAAEAVGPKGRVLGADLQATETAFPPQVTFMQEDVFQPSAAFRECLAELAPFQVVMSDMAPKTTGTKLTDQARSLDLCREALTVARGALEAGGSFVVKIFMGPDVAAFVGEMRQVFSSVRLFKPKSSRPESKEVFYVATGYRPAAARDAGGEPGA